MSQLIGVAGSVRHKSVVRSASTTVYVTARLSFSWGFWLFPGTFPPSYPSIFFKCLKQEAFSKIKDRTDVGVGWLVGPPQKKKSLPLFSAKASRP